MQNRLNYVNLGCGAKFHRDWINLDMTPCSPYVTACNLRKGIPFLNDRFDVIYHSQLLEHFAKAETAVFIKECYRVLKPGGIMRVVVPDLENIATEYLKQLHKNLNNPDAISQADYEWIMLEMYDQSVRNRPGGDMQTFLGQDTMLNEEYLFKRTGLSGKNIRKKLLEAKRGKRQLSGMFKNVLKSLLRVFSSAEMRLGKFRLAGEIHYWMFDRYSLAKLLTDAGFVSIEIKTPFESNIPEWEKFELDVKNDSAFDPMSLFIEAKKPK